MGAGYPGMVSKVELSIKIGCFVKNKNIVFVLKTADLN
jgi:hypothetical protein